jgi:hypothetical protein
MSLFKNNIYYNYMAKYLYKSINIANIIESGTYSVTTTGYPNFYTGASQAAVSIGNDARFGNPSPFSMTDKTGVDMSTYYSAIYNEHNSGSGSIPVAPTGSPNATTYVRAILIGGGGGGGAGGGGGVDNGPSNPKQQTGGGGGGGGGGAITYINKIVYSNYSYNVGTGGTGAVGDGDAGSPGTPGNASIFHNYRANGGEGGEGGGGGSNNQTTNGAGGAGGAAGTGSYNGNAGTPGVGTSLGTGGNIAKVLDLHKMPAANSAGTGRNGGNGGSGTGNGGGAFSGRDGYIRIYYVYE